MDNKLYLAISRRRVSCPQITQQIWDAIKIIRFQRQMPNADRISRYISRVHGINDEEVRRQLLHCSRDNLLAVLKRVGNKGKQTGIERECYQVPSNLERDAHDWYCFECHGSGDVICCIGCHRVYHLACVPKDDLPKEDVKNSFSCSICKALPVSTEESEVKAKELCKLLVYTCARLKEKLPGNIMERKVPSNCSYASGVTSTARSGLQWVVDETEKWRSDFLIFLPMDLEKMEAKARCYEYKSLDEFHSDAKTVVHNVVIYHGVNSPLADVSRQMLRDCAYDLQEIRQCCDCYRVSNEMATKHWFCQPCRPPHELVFAKQKGFPFWPAKVIKVENNQYDVRFFGAYHQRSLLDQSSIRPITVSISTLQVKKSPAWNKALEELRRHQSILNGNRNPDATFKDTESSSENEEGNEQNMGPPPKKQRKKMLAKKGKRPTKASKLKKVVEPPKKEEDVVVPVTEKAVEDLNMAEEGGGGGSQEEPFKLEELWMRQELNAEDDDDEDDDDDDEDEDDTMSSSHKGRRSTKEPEDLVSSSSTEPTTRSVSLQTPRKFLKGDTRKQTRDMDRRVKDITERLQREFEAEKQRAVEKAIRMKEQEMEESMNLQHEAHLARITEEHKVALKEAKKKQWCYNCDCEAIYHCCWNTAYCSTECQQSHWHKEHKRVCRRKR